MGQTIVPIGCSEKIGMLIFVHFVTKVNPSYYSRTLKYNLYMLNFYEFCNVLHNSSGLSQNGP
jgi:hypothetical protein